MKETDFFDAAAEGDLSLLQKLLDSGFDVDICNGEITPLMRAVLNNHLEATVFLVENGADVNRLDYDGWSPLYRSVSVMRENFRLTRYLLEKGSDPTLRINVTYESPLQKTLRYRRWGLTLLFAKNSHKLDEEDRKSLHDYRFKAKLKQSLFPIQAS